MVNPAGLIILIPVILITILIIVVIVVMIIVVITFVLLMVIVTGKQPLEFFEGIVIATSMLLLDTFG